MKLPDKKEKPPRHTPVTEAAFAVPELLELILLHVDMVTLLTGALGVNKSWNSLISTSRALQEALFFAPVLEGYEPESWEWVPQTNDGLTDSGTTEAGDSTASESASSSGPGNGESQEQGAQQRRRVVYNPLLLEKFGSCFFDFGPTYGFFRRTESFHTLPWTSRYYRTVPSGSGGSYHPLFKLVKPMYLENKDYYRAREDRERFTRKGASWRRMLVSQPPPRACSDTNRGSLGYLWWRPDGPYGGPERLACGHAGVLRDADGNMLDVLRMGPLYDLVQHHSGHHVLRSLWFRVTWGTPQPPYVTRVHEEGRQLIAPTPSSYSAEGEVAIRASAVVEFLEFDDDMWFSRREVESVQSFDNTFRCEEANPPAIESPTLAALSLETEFPSQYDLDILQVFVVSSF